MSEQLLNQILAEMQAGFKEVKETISRIEKKLDSTNEQVAANSEAINRIETKLDDQTIDTRGDVRFLNHRVADLEMELDKLKNR